MHSKKPSLSNEASPYMLQPKIPSNNSSANTGKRIIHLKRPSTNVAGATQNPALLIAKNALSQRAASRVEPQSVNELSFASQPTPMTANSPGSYGINPHQQSFGAKPSTDQHFQIIPSYSRAGNKKPQMGSRIQV
jgi:hypothetical protein